MGNCGLQKKVRHLDPDEIDEDSPEVYEKEIPVNAKGNGSAPTAAIVALKRPMMTINLPMEYDSIPAPYDFSITKKIIGWPKYAKGGFRDYLTIEKVRKSIIHMRKEGLRIIPYAYATALGFSLLGKAWTKSKHARRPGIRSRIGNKSVTFNPVDLNDDKVPVGKEKWWRYTMFLLVDPIEKDQFPQKLAENGQLVSVESRTGCEIRIGEKKFLYRGNLVRHVFIDGPTQNAIVCCQNSLPQWFLKNIIIDHINHYRKEPTGKEGCMGEMDKFSGVPVQHQYNNFAN